LEREAGGEALVHEAHGFELELRRVLPLAMWLTTTHEHLLSSERFAVSTKSGQLQKSVLSVWFPLNPFPTLLDV
jgi:alkylhydroperoxidase family enzyme